MSSKTRSYKVVPSIGSVLTPTNRALFGSRGSINWSRYTRLLPPSEMACPRKLQHLLLLVCVCVTVLIPSYYFAIKGLNVSTKTLADSFNVLPVRYFFNQVENQTLINSIFADHENCTNLRKPTESEIVYRHEHWQAHQEGHEDIVVYSAFYDDRPIVGQDPWIRILGVRLRSDKPLWCYAWHSQRDTPFVTEAEIIKTGSDQTMKGGHTYSQNLFSCQLNNRDFIPTHVSLATRLCANSSIYLPVVYNKPSVDWLHNFGACLEVNFGYFAPEVIVQWMEAHSMFGVTSVNVYNGTLDSKLDRVFDYYTKKGILDMRQMPPAVEDYSWHGVRLASPASLNDCMLRNMYTHRFLVVIDFDEMIVPRVHDNYLDMIRDIDRSRNLQTSYHTYSFRNAYFFQYFPEDETQPKVLQSLRLRYRPPPSDYLFGAKSFIDPRHCKSVFNHYCWVRFEHKTALSVDVNTSFALSHHYRKVCPFGPEHCENYDKEKVLDDIMLKYKSELYDRVSKVLKEIGIN